jgi:hypothetical protein
MSVATYQPKCKITLKKNVGRSSTGGGGAPVSQRFAGANKVVDLTPYLGEGGSVVVSRSCREPAGMFSITLADKINLAAADSLYGLIEPMDVIEISMARNVGDYGAAGMPIMMRGFVSEIKRSRNMSTRGPMRQVTITGQDFGKILQIMRITYLPGVVIGQDLLTNFKLFLNYGVGADPNEDAAIFVGNVVQNVIQPFLSAMRKTSGGAAGDQSVIANLNVDAIQGSGVISPFGAQSWPGGTTYDLLKYFGDVGPWNELFIEDRIDGPYLVYRPTPFYSIGGVQIQPGFAIAPPVVISDEDVVGDEVSRSDSDVANYYWVNSPRYNLVDGALLQAAAAGNTPVPPDIFAYGNAAQNLYGVRVMQLDTQQGIRIDGQSEADLAAKTPDALSLVNTKRSILIQNNQDNVVFEQGSMSLKGNEKIKHGAYIRLMRGANAAGAAAGKGSKADYYGYRVAHTYTGMQRFTTEVSFDRGTGFINRVQKGGGADSPYYAEMAIGGTYGA